MPILLSLMLEYANIAFMHINFDSWYNSLPQREGLNIMFIDTKWSVSCAGGDHVPTYN